MLQKQPELLNVNTETAQLQLREGQSQVTTFGWYFAVESK